MTKCKNKEADDKIVVNYEFDIEEYASCKNLKMTYLLTGYDRIMWTLGCGGELCSPVSQKIADFSPTREIKGAYTRHFEYEILAANNVPEDCLSQVAKKLFAVDALFSISRIGSELVQIWSNDPRTSKPNKL